MEARKDVMSRLHSEYENAARGHGPADLLMQIGDVTGHRADEWVSVRSGDGFEATYLLTAETLGPRSLLALGKRLRVVADRDTMTALLLMSS